MRTLFSINWLLIAAAWYGVNGLLHDIFILKSHKGAYDRELLRLLMDGHVLVLSGAVLAVCWWMLREGIVYGSVIGIIISLGMLVYSAMIFPFLKSFVTIFISLMLTVVCIVAYRNLHNIIV